MNPAYKQDIIERAMELDHKDGVNPEDWNKVNEKLLIIIEAVINHCDLHILPLKITSIIRPKIPGFSKTETHSEGRAFDISLIGWTDADARDCCHVINNKLHVGAVSASDKQEREAVFEDGLTAGKGRHIHFQSRR